jgi:hypothetical protein
MNVVEYFHSFWICGDFTLPGERYWSLYRITHWQVKYTGCGTVWHIARLHWSWYRMTHCQVKGTGHGTTTSASHLAMCHMVPRPVYFTWQCAMRYHEKCNLAMSHAVPQPVYFTSQYVIRYDIMPGGIHWSWYHMTHCQVRGTGRGTVWHILTHDQVGNEYKISTNSETIKVFDKPVYFTWHYVIWYHDQCISPGNVSYGTTTSAT